MPPFPLQAILTRQLGTISDPFLISMITTIVNVFSTPVAFYTMERLGRRTLLLWGALGMVVCQFIVAISGVVDGENEHTTRAQISFICIYICKYCHFYKLN